MARDALWYALLIDAERALRSDDDGLAIAARELARSVVDRTVEDPALKECCPDPGLYGLFVASLALWASRTNAVERDRLSGPLTSFISSLGALPRERERLSALDARRAPIERAIPLHDR